MYVLDDYKKNGLLKNVGLEFKYSVYNLVTLKC